MRRIFVDSSDFRKKMEECVEEMIDKKLCDILLEAKEKIKDDVMTKLGKANLW